MSVVGGLLLRRHAALPERAGDLDRFADDLQGLLEEREALEAQLLVFVRLGLGHRCVRGIEVAPDISAANDWADATVT